MRVLIGHKERKSRQNLINLSKTAKMILIFMFWRSAGQPHFVNAKGGRQNNVSLAETLVLLSMAFGRNMLMGIQKPVMRSFGRLSTQ